MSTPVTARANLELIDNSKFFLSIRLENANGQPILILTNSGIGSIYDSENNLILDLPSTTDNLATGVITNQTGIYSISIAKADVTTIPVDKQFNFDISLSLVDFPELNPHKPLRGNIIKLTGRTS